MNIGFVADTSYVYMSGAARSTERFCRYLSARGHKVVILTSRKGGQRKLEQQQGVLIRRFSGLPLPSSKKEAYLALPFFYPVFQTLKKEHVEILHVTEPTFLGFSALVAARVLGLPVVVTSHIQSENVAYNTGLNQHLIRKIFNRYLVLFYSDADMIIFPSLFARNLLFPKGISVPYRIISNGVDVEQFSIQQKDKHLIVKNFTLLTVSRLMKEKRIEVIIRSLPKVLEVFPNTRLIIVGDGLLKKKLQLLARELQLHQAVIFTGLISDEKLREYYSLADAYICASLVELEGMSVLEAMAMGCPLIVAHSPDSAAPALVRSNGFLFRPNDVRDLSFKIRKMLQDETLRRKFRQKSFLLAKKYDIHRSVQALEAAYRDVLKHHYSLTRDLWERIQKFILGSF